MPGACPPCPHTCRHDVIVVDSNGEETHYPAGQAVDVSLADLLRAVGVDLDDTNDDADESEDGDEKPSYRITGVELGIQMVFANEGSLSPAPDRNVDVRMNVVKKAKTWQSVGPRTYYIRYPTGDPGEQYEHKVITYPQDITIDFTPSGYAYRFDFYAMVTAIIDAIVLMVRVLPGFMRHRCRAHLLSGARDAHELS